MTDIVYDIWLTLINSVGPKTAAFLISYFKTAKGVYMASYEELIRSTVSSIGAQNIIASKGHLLEQASKIVTICETANIRILVKSDVDYPNLLKEASDAPHVLYVRGNLNLNYGNFMSIVGTRQASLYGLNMCRKIVNDFKASVPNAITVSGLALGIDKCAHAASIDAGLPTIAVMPGWVDNIVPSSHYYLARQILEKGGAIVSDMPYGTIIKGANFLSRNRIIAALSNATVVIESKLRGGSMVTADIAASYNRDVFTITGDGTESFQGNVSLIKSNKALVIENFKDITNELNWNTIPVKDKVELDNIDQGLVEAFSKLPERVKFCVDEASDLLEVSIVECSRILIKLEVNGLISSMHGRMYVKN